MKKAIMLLVVSSLTGCTSTRLRVVDLDANSGYFPGAAGQATVVESKAVDLDTKKQLIVIRNSDFASGMLAKIGYFDEVMTLSDLEKHIIKENLGDKVQNVNSRIGISNAAKHYKPFLWLHCKSRKDGRKYYAQMLLTDAKNLEDYFITETYLDYTWSGLNDQNNWYPMFNALIDYIRSNSSTYE